MLQENLKQIRLKLGYSQQEIADKLKININTYRGYEYNKREMPYETLRYLIDKFNVNINWLLTGTGNMFLNSSIDDDILISQKNLYNNTVSFKIGNRLTQIQEENKFQDKEMAKTLGIYEYEYIDLKQNSKEPTLKILNNLKQNFNISLDWLLYGDIT